MKKTLLDEFEKTSKNKNMSSLSVTTILPSLIDENNDFEKLNRKKDNSVEITNKILENLRIETNISVLKFVFHEMIANIYDHSNFEKSWIMGKRNGDFYDFGFIDDGITIPISLKNNEYTFKNDCDAIINAINGLSTKNEFDFIERGTGLNNTINIVLNGSAGSVLLVSGRGLIYLEKNKVIKRKLSKEGIGGTMVILRMTLTEEIDIYKYLKQIKI